MTKKIKRATGTVIPENIVRLTPDPRMGLSAEQVKHRLAEGLFNQENTLPTKSVGRIIRDNACTLFNLINLILAAAILAIGSYKNMLFMGVVLCNLAIGVFQELRAKHTVDRLSLLSAVKAHVVRDAKPLEVATDQVVLDDILLLSSGGQVVTDCILLDNECEVNEAFVTGESDAVLKQPGDLLLAGSFVVSGQCTARAEHVGTANYISTISHGAKELKKVHSEIMSTLRKIIKIVSIMIIPVGALLFFNQLRLDGNVFQDAVVQTVAALIGMIPEGLMLLTSTVLAVSVIRLSQHKVLVQELYCIEALARVDTLCLDKTGTLTEGTMELVSVKPLSFVSEEQVSTALRALVAALPDRNATFTAIAEKYTGKTDWKATVTVPFTSQAKWSGATFGSKGSYLLGAAEFLLPDMDPALRIQVDELSREGRVLLLAHSPETLTGKKKLGIPDLPGGLVPRAVLQIRDRIRPEAEQTLRYFAEQGVDVKVISGDNVLTVSEIARRTGISGWERWVDASTLESEEEVKDAAERYTVFGRVTPVQKKQLVQAMKEKGHTVAMTGDGINDVLALKEADCSIAMASGSDAARNISQLVLLNSNFDSMPRVVGEGRRSINNVQRSASLFLVKTIYSAVLAVLFLFVQAPYPFMPIQLTLISAVTIGIPAFVLALEPNNNRIQGNFLRNILIKAVPGAVTIVANVLLVLGAAAWFGLDTDQSSTMCVLLTAFTGLLLLFRLCRPFNGLRRLLFGGLCVIFVGAVLILPGLFSLVPLSLTAALCTLALMVFALLLFSLIMWLMREKKQSK